jgi:TPR repeat protein
LYKMGWGVASDVGRARELFAEAHAAGCIHATCHLGIATGPTTEEGKALLQQAADKGLPEAEYQLGLLHLSGLPEAERNNVLARAYIERAAQQGHLLAQNQMGRMRQNAYPGRFIVDEVETMKWFKKAAKHGLDVGLYNYGLGHKNDWAGPGDKKKAIAYLKAARDAGYAAATPRLEELRTAGFAALIESTPAYCPDPQRLPPLFLEQENNGFQFEPEPAPPAAAAPPPPVGAARVPPVAPAAAPVPPPPAGAHAFHREGGGAGGGGDGDPRPMGSI